VTTRIVLSIEILRAVQKPCRRLEKMMRERKELPVPVKCITDEQIASAIRDLDPDPGSERSGDDSAVPVICLSLLILLIGVLATIWLYLRTY
jgi:hypothetical protein